MRSLSLGRQAFGQAGAVALRSAGVRPDGPVFERGGDTTQPTTRKAVNATQRRAGRFSTRQRYRVRTRASWHRERQGARRGVAGARPRPPPTRGDRRCHQGRSRLCGSDAPSSDRRVECTFTGTPDHVLKRQRRSSRAPCRFPSLLRHTRGSKNPRAPPCASYFPLNPRMRATSAFTTSGLSLRSAFGTISGLLPTAAPPSTIVLAICSSVTLPCHFASV